MDIVLFSSVLRNLLRTEAMCLDEDCDALRTFEKKYCYKPNLQPMFTERALSSLWDSIQEQIIYGIQDGLGLCVLIFRFGGKRFIVGPYARTSYNDTQVQRVLLRKQMPASFASSIKLYYSAFPVLSTFVVRKTLTGCMRAFSGGTEEYTYCQLRTPKEEWKLPQISFSETLDYSTLHQRYDMENRFLWMIETGETERVLEAYHDMDVYGKGKNRYITAVYQDPAIGMAILRTLARKAAERGGASIVEINEITQRATQKMSMSQRADEQLRYTQNMIYELTDAVRHHRYQTGNYSEPIRRAVEFLSLNFSQKITLAQLAERVSLSEVYLSKTFKKEVGMTISQYIAHYRCAQAAELLKGSDISVQEISNYVGYPDNNYFVKVFKAQYGVTPSEYRAEKE